MKRITGVPHMKIVEQFMYFGTTINNARYTPEIKSIATAAFTTIKRVFSPGKWT